MIISNTRTLISVFLLRFLTDGSCFYENRRIENDYCLQNITNCFFTRHTAYIDENACGGVIYVANIAFALRVSDTTFYLCSSGLFGGAIFFSSEGSLNLTKVCAIKCYSLENHYQFTISVTGFNETNSFSLVSIVQCAPIDVYQNNICYSLINGNQILKSVNSSYNTVREVSIGSVVSDYATYFSFCTSANNYAKRYIGLFTSKYSKQKEFIYSNFINNTQRDSYYGTIVYWNSNAVFKHNYYSSNSKPLFHQKENNSTIKKLLRCSQAISNFHYSTIMCQTLPQVASRSCFLYMYGIVFVHFFV